VTGNMWKGSVVGVIVIVVVTEAGDPIRPTACSFDGPSGRTDLSVFAAPAKLRRSDPQASFYLQLCDLKGKGLKPPLPGCEGQFASGFFIDDSTFQESRCYKMGDMRTPPQAHAYGDDGIELTYSGGDTRPGGDVITMVVRVVCNSMRDMLPMEVIEHPRSTFTFEYQSPRMCGRSTAPACNNTGCNFVEGLEIMGDDLKLSEECDVLDRRLTASKEDCCSACKETPGCVGFTWYKRTTKSKYGKVAPQSCFLKEADGKTAMLGEDYVVSGDLFVD